MPYGYLKLRVRGVGDTPQGRDATPIDHDIGEFFLQLLPHCRSNVELL